MNLLSLKNREEVPFFSVIIPAYNAAAFIEAALASVFNQWEQDFEIIVVDDGSVDDTSAILARQTDERLRVISQDNAGVSNARNQAISEARGEYLAFLDADDTWLPNHLTYAKSFFLSNPQYVWYTARARRVENIMPRLNESVEFPPVVSFNVVNWFLEGCDILECGSNFVVKHSIVEKIMPFYPINVKLCEDNMAWCNLALKHPMLGVPDCVTVLYRMWEGSAIHRHGESEDELKNVLLHHKKMYLRNDCPKEAKMYFTRFACDNWWVRIRRRSMYSWRDEVISRSVVMGRGMTLWLIIFVVISEVGCRIAGKLFRIYLLLLKNRIAKEAVKTRKEVSEYKNEKM